MAHGIQAVYKPHLTSFENFPQSQTRNPWTNIGTAFPKYALGAMGAWGEPPAGEESQFGSAIPFRWGIPNPLSASAEGQLTEQALMSNRNALQGFFNRAIDRNTYRGMPDNWRTARDLRYGSALTPFTAAYAQRQFNPLFGAYQMMTPFEQKFGTSELQAAMAANMQNVTPGQAGDAGLQTFRQFLNAPLPTRGAMFNRLSDIFHTVSPRVGEGAIDSTQSQQAQNAILQEAYGDVDAQRQALELVALKGINPLFAGPIQSAIRRLASTYSGGGGPGDTFIEQARARGWIR
jgi:hypothetical protein